MLLTDQEITNLCVNHEEDYHQFPLIKPFHPKLVSKVNNARVISYGQSSSGYDIRLGRKFKAFRNAPEHEIDPKNFDPSLFNHIEVPEEANFVIIPPNSFILGHTMERFIMPNNLMGVAMGKSTYARCGIMTCITPLEPGWEGYLTIEIANCTRTPARVYVEEGICQILFFKTKQACSTSYADRYGKYQNQEQEVVTAK